MKANHVPIPRYRAQGGLAILSMGFRPFFLLAGLWAATALPLTIFQLLGNLELPSAFDPVTWHLHEMLFGFIAATLTGFLLTAIPNWTGHLPLQGMPLLGLVALWIAGRCAVATSALIGGPTAAVIDIAFLATVATLATREIVAGRNWRNLPILAGVALFLAGDILIHGAALGAIPQIGIGERLAIATLVALIALVGGRIVPSFTRNWLVKRGHDRLPASFGPLDRATLAITILALADWTAVPEGPVTGSLLALAALANAVRLARWQGQSTGAEALVWVLHLGYAWIPAGLALLALSQWWDDLSPAAALHGLTAGAMGTMTLAVMSRATMGHTGRALHAGPGLAAAYLLVSLAAGARIVATLWADAAVALLWIAAAAWVGAFLLFLVICGPMLILRQPPKAAE